MKSIVVAVACLAITTLASAQTPPPADGVKVTVTVNNVLSASGMLRGMLCPDPNIFPNTGCTDAFYTTAPAAAGAVELNFTGVKPGTYALAISHDEDNDGRLNVFAEAFAFGNNAKDLPPIFDTAALKVTGDLKTETTLFRMVQ
jgi:uncharacterized protein (DUF2141 family)